MTLGGCSFAVSYNEAEPLLRVSISALHDCTVYYRVARPRTFVCFAKETDFALTNPLELETLLPTRQSLGLVLAFRCTVPLENVCTCRAPGCVTCIELHVAAGPDHTLRLTVSYQTPTPPYTLGAPDLVSSASEVENCLVIALDSENWFGHAVVHYLFFFLQATQNSRGTGTHPSRDTLTELNKPN